MRLPSVICLDSFAFVSFLTLLAFLLTSNASAAVIRNNSESLSTQRKFWLKVDGVSYAPEAPVVLFELGSIGGGEGGRTIKVDKSDVQSALREIAENYGSEQITSAVFEDLYEISGAMDGIFEALPTLEFAEVVTVKKFYEENANGHQSSESEDSSEANSCTLEAFMQKFASPTELYVSVGDNPFDITVLRKPNFRNLRRVTVDVGKGENLENRLRPISTEEEASVRGLWANGNERSYSYRTYEANGYDFSGDFLTRTIEDVRGCPPALIVRVTTNFDLRLSENDYNVTVFDMDFFLTTDTRYSSKTSTFNVILTESAMTTGRSVAFTNQPEDQW